MESVKFNKDEQAVVITTQPTSSTADACTSHQNNNATCSTQDNIPLLNGHQNSVNPSWYQNTCCWFDLFECLYNKCCCYLLDCVTDMSLDEAISRYEEELLLSVPDFIETLSKNRYLIQILEILYNEFPEYFFTYLPTGSLREGFGKHISSTSILATDYDIMLVPDAVPVGMPDTDYEDRSVVFVAINNLQKDGYLWLKLQDKYLQQWERLCIRRHVFDEGCSLLSARRLRDVIRDTIEKSVDLKFITKKHFANVAEHDVNVAITNNGPALTVAVSSIHRSLFKRDEEMKHFYADFTFGLHCLHWPEEAKGFFASPHRENWPTSKAVELILKKGCHVVPKSSTDLLVKLAFNQEENTMFGTAPGLEWRYSFSQPEILLSTEIPAPAKTAFLAFKAFVKRHCNTTNVKIRSYALKCILYTVVETKPPGYWEVTAEVENLFRQMMSTLENHLIENFSPNYWIPSINLFDKLSTNDTVLLLKPILKAKKRPQKYVANNFLEHMRCFRKCCCCCSKLHDMPWTY